MENQNLNQPNQPTPSQPGGMLPALPNATAILVLGICSIAFCWTAGIVGLALGIVAMVMAGKAKALYDANPGIYSMASFNNLKAGKICSIIGIILSALYLVYVVVIILILGAAVSSMPWNSFH